MLRRYDMFMGICSKLRRFFTENSTVEHLLMRSPVVHVNMAELTV